MTLVPASSPLVVSRNRPEVLERAETIQKIPEIPETSESPRNNLLFGDWRFSTRISTFREIAAVYCSRTPASCRVSGTRNRSEIQEIAERTEKIAEIAEKTLVTLQWVGPLLDFSEPSGSLRAERMSLNRIKAI